MNKYFAYTISALLAAVATFLVPESRAGVWMWLVFIFCLPMQLLISIFISKSYEGKLKNLPLEAYLKLVDLEDEGLKQKVELLNYTPVFIGLSMTFYEHESLSYQVYWFGAVFMSLIYGYITLVNHRSIIRVYRKHLGEQQ